MKLIFFDIDGTLVPNGIMKMSKGTKEAIRQARANGHICMINTGRTKKLVGEELTGQVEFDGYLLGCGTMMIYHNELLLHKTFERELSKRILEGLTRYRIDAVLEGSEEIYGQPLEMLYTASFRKYLSKHQKLYCHSFENAVGNYDKLYLHVDNLKELDGFYKEFEAELDFIDREGGFFEVVPKGYSKATAIHYMAQRLQIPMEDTVAIGDSNNDLAMLSCVNTAIAMGNATKRVLDIAHRVTTCVDEDGVWNALKWLGVI